MPAQSIGIVWNLTCVKPTSSSLTVLALSVRVQLKARLKKGESFVAVSSLSSGARSGSDVYFWYEKRPNIRSLSERFASIFTSPWWARWLSELGATRLLEAPDRLGSG